MLTIAAMRMPPQNKATTSGMAWRRANLLSFVVALMVWVGHGFGGQAGAPPLLDGPGNGPGSVLRARPNPGGFSRG